MSSGGLPLISIQPSEREAFNQLHDLARTLCDQICDNHRLPRKKFRRRQRQHRRIARKILQQLDHLRNIRRQTRTPRQQPQKQRQRYPTGGAFTITPNRDLFSTTNIKQEPTEAPPYPIYQESAIH